MSVASEITRISGAKAALKTAIEAKGVTVPSATKIEGYPALVSAIPVSKNPWVKNGDTHLWISIDFDDYLAQQIRIRMIGTIDWGDGSTVESVSVTTYTTFTHTYAQKGQYRIDLHPTSGTFYLGNNSNAHTVMGTRNGANYGRTTVLYQVEVGTSRITQLTTYCLAYNAGLRWVYIPSTIVSITNYVFYNDYGLKDIEYQDPSTIANTGFTATYYQCHCLKNVAVPSGLTTFNTGIYLCYSLKEVTIPSGVTTMADSSLRGLYCLEKLTCLPTSPPTATGTNTFTGFPTTCDIYVPYGSLSAYQAAEGWSAFASQMIEMPQPSE